MPITTELKSDKKPPSGGPSKKRGALSTRGGTAVVATVAGLAALAILLVFMSNYRDSVRSGANEVRVLVANRTIDEGTSGDVVAEAGLFEATTVSEVDAVEGAFTDPAAIHGQITTETIYSGEQLTPASFASGADPIAGKLEGTQRALAVPVGEAEGNVGQLKSGSRVDVLGGFGGEQAGGRTRPIMDVLARDVLVLKEALDDGSSGSNSNENHQVVLRVSDIEASRIAFAAETGQIWLTLRPPTLAKDSNIKPVQLENLIGLDLALGD